MLPRGIRNHNPLNIRRSKDQWKGMAEVQSDRAFVQFKSGASYRNGRHRAKTTLAATWRTSVASPA